MNVTQYADTIDAVAVEIAEYLRSQGWEDVRIKCAESTLSQYVTASRDGDDPDDWRSVHDITVRVSDHAGRSCNDPDFVIRVDKGECFADFLSVINKSDEFRVSACGI